jgi:hypothetical protein
MAFEKMTQRVVHAPPEPSGAATWLCVGLLSIAALSFVVFSRPPATVQPASTESIARSSTADAAPAAAASSLVEKNTTATIVAPSSESALVASNNKPADEPPAPTPSPTVEAGQSIAEPAVLVLNGSFAKENNALVYDEDALVLLGDGGLLSSPNGVMVSDEKQKLFVGDLTLDTGEHTFVGTDAVLDVERGRMTG